ncbi:MAG TPA: serine/threonine-protein kinase, partial [Verrucomicrobiae bacterium]|nr:serine/threonine-protein kinase [Verrucomicrobiae bacterium]
MTGSAVAPALRIPDYELLQLVGRGSYGEVWMAHNALGSLRAVKVVWRKNFEDERPYEREFRGIRKFEPVSRKHEGLIDLYHVGRNNDEGYFYYAMELADDAAPVIASEGEYRPRTLREELRARGRLSIDKAVEIGIKLASALEHLHRAGLIHRDIKPSNIIFVDGAPKLADIGLVAGISDARSFVGTEGFVPPEGPGTPGADIFSLGKVLYETSTGLDRNDFPKLPPVGADSGIDPGKFSEFNEVLLKACEPSPQSRYRTAEELLNDLLWIREGKSLCRLRGWQRRKAFLWKIGAAAVLGSAMFLAASRYQPASRPVHGHFEKSELQKVEELFEKDDADGALASLARIVRSNPNDRPAAERLMAALTWRNFMVPSVEPIAVESRPRFVSFSPDGEEVALALSNGTLQFRDAATGERTWEEQASEDGVTAMAWSPDRTHLIITGQRSGRIYDALARRSVVEGLVHDSRIVSVQFSPAQPWILTGASSGTAQVWDAHDARLVEKSFAHDGPIRQAMFSPDGRYVATAGLGDGAIRIWDFATMQPTSPVLRHGRSINAMAF